MIIIIKFDKVWTRKFKNPVMHTIYVIGTCNKISIFQYLGLISIPLIMFIKLKLYKNPQSNYTILHCMIPSNIYSEYFLIRQTG